MDISPKGSEIFRQSDEALPRQPAKDVCPKGEISQSYVNKRADGFIFSHLKTIYMRDIFAHVTLSLEVLDNRTVQYAVT